MIKSLALLLTLAGVLAAQNTAVFPGAVATDTDLTVASNRAITTLAAPLDAVSSTVTVADTGSFIVPTVLSIESEILKCTGKTTTTFTGCTRHFDGTSPASHAATRLVANSFVAFHANQTAAEIKAIEAALGPNLANVIASARAAVPIVFSSTYNFTPQAPGGSLIASGVNQVVSLAPCPLGVNGADVAHALYISGGTGTAEAPVITGGTCTSGAASGTVTITPAYVHSGAWTIGSASAGIQEAAMCSGGCEVRVPPASVNIFGTISLPGSVDLSCQMGTTLLWQGGAADVIRITTNGHRVTGCAISSANVALTSGYGINLAGGGWTTLDKITISNTHSGIGVTAGAFLVTIADSRIMSYGQAAPTTAWAIELLGHPSDVRIKNTFIFGGANSCASQSTAPNGVRLKDAEGVYADTLEVNCASNGIMIDPGTGEFVINNWFNEAIVDNSGSAAGSSGLTIAPTGTGYAMRNYVRHGWFSTNNRSGILFDSSGCAASCIYANTVQDSEIGNNSRDGILFKGLYAGQNIISGNQIFNNSASAAGTYHGINLQGGQDNQIVGNMIGFPGSDSQGYGIYNAGAQYSLVSGNFVRGYTTGPVYESEAPTSGGNVYSTNLGVDRTEVDRTQTAALVSANLYANAPPGVYRVGAWITGLGVSAGACTSVVSVGSDWYTGPRSDTLITFDQAIAYNRGNASVLVSLGSIGTNITRAVTLSGANCSGATYDVIFTLDKIR